jgi:uncharacterized protein with HEPN domain
MQPDEREAGYLWDMTDAARTALDITAGYTRPRYLSDRTVQLAVERLIEIIGEAARRISRESQDAHPEIPWRRIIAQRHVLAHEYGEIKQERMWRLVTEDLPELLAALGPLVSREE